MLLRILRHEEEAEDASQEVFLRMFKSFESYDSTRPFSPWASRITYNVCLRRLEGKSAAILREASSSCALFLPFALQIRSFWASTESFLFYLPQVLCVFSLQLYLQL
jgi:DNA-directed RNA polymerase specialized sigma24 family protein